MLLSAAQPYFAPYPGFFEKILLSDLFVVLDAVQFPRGTTWLTRNRFKNDRGTLRLTLPVYKKHLGLQRVDKVCLDQEKRWREKHLDSLKHAYVRSPWFGDHLGFVATLFDGRYDRLIDLNLSVISYLSDQLDIPTPILRQSDLGIENTGSRLLIDICRQLGADGFMVQRPAAKYYDEGTFDQAGIAIRTFQPARKVYPQLWGPFIPNLSAFDLLFNCGPRAADILHGN